MSRINPSIPTLDPFDPPKRRDFIPVSDFAARSGQGTLRTVV